MFDVRCSPSIQRWTLDVRCSMFARHSALDVDVRCSCSPGIQRWTLNVRCSCSPCLLPRSWSFVRNEDGTMSAVVGAGLQPADKILDARRDRGTTGIGGGAVVLVPDHELGQDSTTRIAAAMPAVQVNVPEPAAMHRSAARRSVDVFPNAERQAGEIVFRPRSARRPQAPGSRRQVLASVPLNRDAPPHCRQPTGHVPSGVPVGSFDRRTVYELPILEFVTLHGGFLRRTSTAGLEKA